MSVVIRMKRAGAKKRPFYRVVVANSRSPRDGRYIEQLGYYDPLTNPATFKVDAERLASWIQSGALPSESVGVMVAKYAPEALRRAPAPVAPVEVPVEGPEPKKAKTAKTAKQKAARAKSAKQPKAATKGSAKKAMTRAKAKAKKASGIVAKPKAKKKPKK